MRRITHILTVIIAGTMVLTAQRPAEIVVALDGTGAFRSIQDALNSIPAGRTDRTTIIVRNGTYHEKLFISVSNIAIVGESRESTVIEFPELRKNWLRQHPTDRGSATVNIDSGTADIILANLTIINPYGDLYGDHDHQFAIWGKGTRIALLYCTVTGGGGDTVSLWNSDDGMYYHAECSFEGWVDYVCPRGWCYITDSRFYGHNLTATLWHHGSADPRQKFVIRSSYFDGVPGFPLGRHHVDGQFFLLDCLFSRAMADSAIHYPSYSPNARPWKWGRRHYYFNCHREGGDYDWFADNLHTAEGSPTPEQITPAWTFDGRWQPDSCINGVLPFPAFPSPRPGAYLPRQTGLLLRWVPPRGASVQRLFFGTSSVPAPVGEITRSAYAVSSLTPGTRYFWRVETVVHGDTLRSPLWHFTIRN